MTVNEKGGMFVVRLLKKHDEANSNVSFGVCPWYEKLHREKNDRVMRDPIRGVD